MIGYILLCLTALIYLVLGIFALQTAPSGGDQTYGHAYSAFVIFAAYGLLSLVLTIYITAIGGYNWISDVTFKRNAIVAIIWLGMMSGVTYCIGGRVEYHKFYQLTGIVRWYSYIIYYGAIWLPLLMLIPYFILIKPEWRDTVSPNLVKYPLILACISGFLLLMTPKIMKGNLLKFFPKLDDNELAINAAMRNIGKYQDVMSLLYYTSSDYDEKIRNAALTKIKASKNLEEELIEVLEKSNPYAVYEFLDQNKVKHPERFIEPITKSISKVVLDTKEDIVNPYKSGVFDVEVLLHVLDGQFKDHASIFKPHIIKLEEVLETPPAQNRYYGGTEEINEAIYKYRAIVKDWLEKH